MDETVNNIEDITSFFVIIEYYNNNFFKWRAREGHAGGGRETIIQFVVALSRKCSYQTIQIGKI